MRDDQLRSFLLAAETGSFSRAAKEEFLSVPSFINRINTLEQELGFSLFERDAKGITLTKAGRDFHETAQQALMLIEAGKEKGLRSATERDDILVLGFDAGSMPPFFVNITTGFERLHPNILVQYQQLPYADLVGHLLQGEIDTCFFIPPNNDHHNDIEFIPLYRDGLVCILGRSHALANRPILALEDLKGEATFIDGAYRNGPDNKELYDEAARQGLEIVEKPIGSQWVLDVATGKGVMFTPSRYTTEQYTDLVSIPLDWPPVIQGLLVRKQYGNTVELFIEACREYFKKN